MAQRYTTSEKSNCQAGQSALTFDALSTVSRLMRPNDAARYLGVSEATPAKWRCGTSAGPPYVKLGTRIVAYDQDELDAWMKSRKRGFTTDRVLPEGTDD